MNGESESPRRRRAAAWMKPLGATVPAFTPAHAARRRLEREALRFLVVLAPGTGRLVGAVDRESLAPAPCCERREGRCTVAQHLARGVAFCFAHEGAAGVAEAEAELAAAGKAPSPRAIPLVVVDRQLKPLGTFAPAGAEDEVPPAPARAA
jgi:hypothetical protein